MNCDETAGTSFLGWPEVLRHETSITHLPAYRSDVGVSLIVNLKIILSLLTTRQCFLLNFPAVIFGNKPQYHKQQLSRKTQDRYGLTKGPSKVKGLNIYLGRIGGPEGGM